MTQDDQEKYIREYVSTTRQHFSTYHNHKEQMAYITTGLYLTGASAFFFQKVPEGLCKSSYQWSIGVVVALLTLIILLFVCRQLSLRSVASNIIAACDLCRLKWLKAFYRPEVPICHKKYKPYKYIEIDMPKFLYDEMGKIKQSKSAKRLKFLTLSPIILTFIVLLLRIFYTSSREYLCILLQGIWRRVGMPLPFAQLFVGFGIITDFSYKAISRL